MSQSENDTLVNSEEEEDVINEELKKDTILMQCFDMLKDVKVPKKRRRGRPPSSKNQKTQMKSVVSEQKSEDEGSSASVKIVENQMFSAGESLLQRTLSDLIKEMARMSSVVGDLTNKMDEVLLQVASLKTENATLRDEIRNKDDKIFNLELQLDDIDQETKNKEVIISGSAVDATADNVQAAMENILSGKLKVSPESAAKYKFRRMGQSKNAVLVDCCEKDERKTLFVAVKTMRPDNLFVAESLTKRRRTLMFHLRLLKRAKKIYTAFSFYGRIYIKMSEHDAKKELRSLLDIKDLVSDYNKEAINNQLLQPIQLQS